VKSAGRIVPSLPAAGLFDIHLKVADQGVCRRRRRLLTGTQLLCGPEAVSRRVDVEELMYRLQQLVLVPQGAEYRFTTYEAHPSQTPGKGTAAHHRRAETVWCPSTCCGVWDLWLRKYVHISSFSILPVADRHQSRRAQVQLTAPYLTCPT